MLLGRDGPGRINGFSATRRQEDDPFANDVGTTVADLFARAVSPRQDTGDVPDDITHVSPAVAASPIGSNAGALGDAMRIVGGRDNLKRRQLPPGGSDSAGVGSILSNPADLLGTLLGAAGQVKPPGADATQRKRAARGFAGGFLDNILEAFTGAAKGSDSESAQRRQLGSGSDVDSTDTLDSVVASVLDNFAGREFPPVSTDAEPLSVLPGGKRGLETVENPDLGGVDGVPASPLTGDDSGDDDDDNDDGDNDDGDNDDGDNDDGDNDDGDNDDGDNDDGDNSDDEDNGNSDGLASTISNAPGGAGLDDVTAGATHPLDARSSEFFLPPPPPPPSSKPSVNL